MDPVFELAVCLVVAGQPPAVDAAVTALSLTDWAGTPVGPWPERSQTARLRDVADLHPELPDRVRARLRTMAGPHHRRRNRVPVDVDARTLAALYAADPDLTRAILLHPATPRDLYEGAWTRLGGCLDRPGVAAGLLLAATATSQDAAAVLAARPPLTLQEAAVAASCWPEHHRLLRRLGGYAPDALKLVGAPSSRQRRWIRHRSRAVTPGATAGMADDLAFALARANGPGNRTVGFVSTGSDVLDALTALPPAGGAGWQFATVAELRGCRPLTPALDQLLATKMSAVHTAERTADLPVTCAAALSATVVTQALTPKATVDDSYWGTVLALADLDGATFGELTATAAAIHVA